MTTPFGRVVASGVFGRVLGEDVTYQPVAGDAATVRGIFSAPYRRLDLAESGVDVQAPSCDVAVADLADGGRQGATLTRDGVAYAVVGVEPDGEGLVRLVLEEP